LEQGEVHSSVCSKGKIYNITVITVLQYTHTHTYISQPKETYIYIFIYKLNEQRDPRNFKNLAKHVVSEPEYIPA
jgi:hypothetical protein